MAVVELSFGGCFFCCALKVSESVKCRHARFECWARGSRWKHLGYPNSSYTVWPAVDFLSGRNYRVDLVECVAEFVGCDVEFVLVLKGQPELCAVVECLG